ALAAAGIVGKGRRDCDQREQDKNGWYGTHGATPSEPARLPMYTFCSHLERGSLVTSGARTN
ncbi:MAG TPA: hypothetical protein VK249_15030, partial [Anaerolineales bacterium]|nr:hypothetical protein [Anaerolineales bacterium]